jgi:hypothetical protein
MVWTDITRMHYAPVSGHLPRDLNDVQWDLLEPLLPRAAPAGASAHGEFASGFERDFVYCNDGVPMAAIADTVSAVHVGSMLFLSMARRADLA